LALSRFRLDASGTVPLRDEVPSGNADIDVVPRQAGVNVTLVSSVGFYVQTGVTHSCLPSLEPEMLVPGIETRTTFPSAVDRGPDPTVAAGHHAFNNRAFRVVP
jgi:hypothetical protein